MLDDTDRATRSVRSTAVPPDVTGWLCQSRPRPRRTAFVDLLAYTDVPHRGMSGNAVDPSRSAVYSGDGWSTWR